MNDRKYAHMCRDGHVEIGHNDSENERCPLCRAIDNVIYLQGVLSAMSKRASHAIETTANIKERA